MRLGVFAPTFGDDDVLALAAPAREAEAAGWDGVFIWDGLLWIPEGVGATGPAETTVALAAVAPATERVRFGALVTPLARRRPWRLAKETATLDRLSGGRLVVGVGLGARPDMEPVGEVAGFWPNRQPFRRAARWDGALPLKRGAAAPFDLVVIAEGGRRADLAPRYAEAGATWRLDAVDPRSEGIDSFQARVRAGPPG